MDFHEEVAILRNCTDFEILEIKFKYNSAVVKWFFDGSSDRNSLLLICENLDNTVVKSYPFLFKAGRVHINGYMGRFMNYANELQDTNTYSFTDFYKRTKEAIHAIEIPIDGVTIQHHTLQEGRRLVRTAIRHSPFPNEAIYYNHIRRTPITEKQYEKVAELLGKEYADYLKKNGITAVFTADPLKKKDLIILKK